METKRVLYILFEVLSWLSLLVLVIWFLYFVRDIWSDFQDRKTNDRVYSNRSNTFEHPTITICFEPQVNTTKLKEYNMTLDDFSKIEENYFLLQGM